MMTPTYRAELRQQVTVHPDMSVNDKTIILGLIDEIEQGRMALTAGLADKHKDELKPLNAAIAKASAAKVRVDRAHAKASAEADAAAAADIRRGKAKAEAKPACAQCGKVHDPFGPCATGPAEAPQE